MKKLLFKILLGIVGLVLIAVLVFVGSYYWGYRIAQAPMVELRSSIELGMSRAEVLAHMAEYENMHDWGSAGNMQLSQASENTSSLVVGTWFCILHIQMDDNVDASLDDVFCVD